MVVVNSRRKSSFQAGVSGCAKVIALYCGELRDIKLPKMSPQQESADNAARAARPEATGSSATTTGWDRIRRETEAARGDSGSSCGSHRRLRCGAASKRRG